MLSGVVLGRVGSGIIVAVGVGTAVRLGVAVTVSLAVGVVAGVGVDGVALSAVDSTVVSGVGSLPATAVTSPVRQTATAFSLLISKVIRLPFAGGRGGESGFPFNLTSTMSAKPR